MNWVLVSLAAGGVIAVLAAINSRLGRAADTAPAGSRLEERRQLVERGLYRGAIGIGANGGARVSRSGTAASDYR